MASCAVTVGRGTKDRRASLAPGDWPYRGASNLARRPASASRERGKANAEAKIALLRFRLPRNRLAIRNDEACLVSCASGIAQRAPRNSSCIGNGRLIAGLQARLPAPRKRQAARAGMNGFSVCDGSPTTSGRKMFPRLPGQSECHLYVPRSAAERIAV
jgi:hypothetical protein